MINELEKYNELRRAAKTPNGKFIYEFIKQEAGRTFDYAIINAEGKDEDVGRDFKTVNLIKEFFKKIDNILTSNQER